MLPCLHPTHLLQVAEDVKGRGSASIKQAVEYTAQTRDVLSQRAAQVGQVVSQKAKDLYNGARDNAKSAVDYGSATTQVVEPKMLQHLHSAYAHAFVHRCASLVCILSLIISLSFTVLQCDLQILNLQN